jgi:hypothetical protein
MPDSPTRPLTQEEQKEAEANARRMAEEFYETEMEALKNTVVAP